MGFTYQINNDIKWNRREDLLKKAKENSPKIFFNSIIPIGLSEIIKDKNSFLEVSTKTNLLDMKNLSDYVLGRNESIILDLGDHYVGSFSINVNSKGSPMDAPLYLKIKFAEVPAELDYDSSNYNGWLSKSWIQEEYLHFDTLPKRIELPRRYSCRFIEIKVIDTSPKWKAVFSNPEFVAETSANECKVKKYDVSDPDLEKIYNISVKTLKNCMQDVFEDGPKRDRRLWLGDLRLQALVNYDTFDQNDIVKRCLYLFGGMTTSDGKIAANIFTSSQIIPDDTFLFDYSLFFAVVLYDYISHVEDWQILDDLYDVAKRQIDLALNLVDTEGRLNLLDEWPVFIDWSNDFDKTTAGQAILIYSLRRFIKLAEKMSDNNIEYYKNELNKMIMFSKKTLFDDDRKLFITENTKEINIASQSWMVLAEVMDMETNKQIMQNAVDHLFPITGIGTPYMYHYIAESLLFSGLIEEGVFLIKSYWGKMIELGADTFWEAFRPEDRNFSPYGSPIISSFCHAWSCTPVYLITKYMLK